MEYLTNSLKEVVSKLSENQKEEIDVIESIVNTNETNKENTKEKLFKYIEKRKPENCIHFILNCIEHASTIRPKKRETFLFLLTSVFNNFNINFENTQIFGVLRNMLQVKNIIPSDRYISKHIFDFAEEGTVGRAIFEDNIELLQQLLAVHPDEGKEQILDVRYFLPSN